MKPQLFLTRLFIAFWLLCAVGWWMYFDTHAPEGTGVETPWWGKLMLSLLIGALSSYIPVFVLGIPFGIWYEWRKFKKSCQQCGKPNVKAGTVDAAGKVQCATCAYDDPEKESEALSIDCAICGKTFVPQPDDFWECGFQALPEDALSPEELAEIDARVESEQDAKEFCRQAEITREQFEQGIEKGFIETGACAVCPACQANAEPMEQGGKEVL